MSNSSIGPIDRTLSGATTTGLSGPGSNGNEDVFSIIGASPSVCLMSYPGHLLGGGKSRIPLQKCSWCILQTQLDCTGDKFSKK